MRVSVMQMFFRLILAFAFVASTVHAPAIAHEGPANHHVDQIAVSADGAILGHDGDTPSSSDIGDSVHHHHCPTALDTRVSDIALGVESGKALLPFDRASILTSFSQAPPTEPPSA